MDRFLTIDWHPHLEDVIDNIFISEERLERDSVMHKIITGSFVDPFKDMDEEYKNCSTHFINHESINFNANGEKSKGKKGKGKKLNDEDLKKKPYTPGLVKLLFKFPRKSDLNKEQQALCLRVMLRFTESEKPAMTSNARGELRQYLALKDIISKEQDQFLEFAKSNWPKRQLHLQNENYINARWKSKLDYIKNLPRYYSEVKSIPFVACKDVGLTFLSTCLQLGTLRKVLLPTFTKRVILDANAALLNDTFSLRNDTNNETPACFKLPVSEDSNCEKLAEDNKVDMVISSSGLNCLVNNLGPTYNNSWILPVVIKEQNGKNVIYIDKPPPPITNTIPQKNRLLYKHVLKRSFTLMNDSPSKRIKTQENDIFESNYAEKLLELEEAYENSFVPANEKTCNEYDNNESEKMNTLIPETHCVDNNQKNNQDEDVNMTAMDDIITDSQMSENNQNASPEDSINEFVSYKLFALSPKTAKQNELLKNSVIKEYKMLVRTKTDGFETSENGEKRLVMLSPKLEHQVDMGAEAMTLDESLKEWISLVFRPNTSLIRVRISAETSEALQIERRTPVSINNELKRLYDINAENSLILLHNLMENLTHYSPGRYLLRHTVRNGAFISVYKETEEVVKSTFDLHMAFGNQYYTMPNAPWLALDKTVITPMMKLFERMPAMFWPADNQKFTVSKKGKKAVKVRPRIPNTGAVRRSARNMVKK